METTENVESVPAEIPFEKALKRIDAETSDYYMLGYYSSNPDPTKRTRKIEIKTSRADTAVWSRSQYSIKRPGTK